MLGTMFILSTLIAVVIFGYFKVNENGNVFASSFGNTETAEADDGESTADNAESTKSEKASNTGSNGKSPLSVITDIFLPVEKRVNFLILGIDKDGTRTDTMIMGCFNSEQKAVDLVSLPRDTMITLPRDRIDTMIANDRFVPKGGVMKLNEVHHYAGPKLGMDFLMQQIQDLTGVSFKYYVVVDLDAFRYIVDEVDGVEFDVPFTMDYYDPDQDLKIYLKAGVQTLNGDQAEQLVRFRKMNDGSHADYNDWKRNETQQQFIKALVLQTLRKDKIIGNASALVKAMFKYVKTNVNLGDALKYIPYVKSLNEDSIRLHTLVGEDKIVNGKWYTIWDEAASKEVIDGVFGQ